jgi:copper transport protein
VNDRRAPGRVLARAAAGVVLAVSALLAGAGTASAHAVLESTNPAANTVLLALPPQVTLTFGESVLLPPNGLRVFDPDGVQVDDGSTGHPGGAGDTVAVGLRPGSAQGSYTVAWRVISADTHPVSGAFTFSVGHASATAAAVAAPPGGSAAVAVLYGIVRALAYASFAALVGAAALLLFCWPRGAARAAGPRVAAGGWVGLLGATVGTLLLQGPYGDGTGLDTILTPGSVASTLQLPLGSALVARLLLLVAAAIHLGLLVRRLPTADHRTRAALRWSGAALAVGMAATWSVAGHAAVGLQPVIAFPADVAHLVAMAVWLGGLLVLTVALWPPAWGAQEDGELAAAVSRFSPIAFGCVVVLVGTGTYQSWRQLGSWSAFVDTGYGRILLVKIVAVAVVIGVAAVSRHAVHARPTPGPHVTAGAGATAVATTAPHPVLRRTVAVETAIAVAVLGLTAVLVDAEPGRTAEAATAAAAAGPVDGDLHYDTGGPGGTGTVSVRIDPARTGPDTLEVTVRNAAGDHLDPPGLEAELSLPERGLGPLTLALHRTATGTYAGSGQIPLAGTWQLALTVRTDDLDETTVRLPVPVR